MQINQAVTCWTNLLSPLYHTTSNAMFLPVRIKCTMKKISTSVFRERIKDDDSSHNDLTKPKRGKKRLGEVDLQKSHHKCLEIKMCEQVLQDHTRQTYRIFQIYRKIFRLFVTYLILRPFPKKINFGSANG